MVFSVIGEPISHSLLAVADIIYANDSAINIVVIKTFAVVNLSQTHWINGLDHGCTDQKGNWCPMFQLNVSLIENN